MTGYRIAAEFGPGSSAPDRGGSRPRAPGRISWKGSRLVDERFETIRDSGNDHERSNDQETRPGRGGARASSRGERSRRTRGAPGPGSADPEPGPGEVLVAVAAAGVNFIDIYQRAGLYPMRPRSSRGRRAPGGDGRRAGVTDMRSATSRLGGRHRLATPTRSSSPPAERVAVPDGGTTEDAAALMLQGMTAHYLCESTYPVRAGDTACVHAGAGGVGLLLTQLITRQAAAGCSPPPPPRRRPNSPAGPAPRGDRLHRRPTSSPRSAGSPTARAWRSSTTASGRPPSRPAWTPARRAACWCSSARPAARSSPSTRRRSTRRVALPDPASPRHYIATREELLWRAAASSSSGGAPAGSTSGSAGATPWPRPAARTRTWRRDVRPGSW